MQCEDGCVEVYSVCVTERWMASGILSLILLKTNGEGMLLYLSESMKCFFFIASWALPSGVRGNSFQRKGSLAIQSWIPPAWLPRAALTAFTAHVVATESIRSSHICCVPDCVLLMQWLMADQNIVCLYGLISNKTFRESGPAALWLWESIWQRNFNGSLLTLSITDPYGSGTTGTL